MRYSLYHIDQSIALKVEFQTLESRVYRGFPLRNIFVEHIHLHINLQRLTSSYNVQFTTLLKPSQIWLTFDSLEKKHRQPYL